MLFHHPLPKATPLKAAPAFYRLGDVIHICALVSLNQTSAVESERR